MIVSFTFFITGEQKLPRIIFSPILCSTETPTIPSDSFFSPYYFRLIFSECQYIEAGASTVGQPVKQERIWFTEINPIPILFPEKPTVCFQQGETT